ncbi:15117_t:CDS:1, partial [Funneliformis geosporum]
ETSHIAAFLDPRYKKYCFPEMISYEIQLPIRSLLEQQQQQGVPIISTKKVSSFLKKLKGTTSVIINEDDEVHKYWISAEAEED